MHLFSGAAAGVLLRSPVLLSSNMPNMQRSVNLQLSAQAKSPQYGLSMSSIMGGQSNA